MKRLSAVKMRWVWVICFRPCDASVICLQRDPYASLPSQPVLTSPGLITFSIKSRSSLAHVFPVPFPSTTTRTVLSPGARPPGLAYWRGEVVLPVERLAGVDECDRMGSYRQRCDVPAGIAACGRRRPHGTRLGSLRAHRIGHVLLDERRTNHCALARHLVGPPSHQCCPAFRLRQAQIVPAGLG
jgi:hypothetical protein